MSKYGQNFKDIKYELSRNYKLCKLNDKKTYEELQQTLCEYILKSVVYEKALDNACELLEEYSSYDDPTPKDEWKERCLKDE